MLVRSNAKLLLTEARSPIAPRGNISQKMTNVRDISFPAIKPTSKIFGSGEMADLIRAFDWSTTPVGPIENWPEVLLIAVNTILATRHPMFLWWGEHLIQLYNDGYRPSIRSDKHPKALGQPGGNAGLRSGISLVRRLKE